MKRSQWPYNRPDTRAWPPTNDARAAGELVQQPLGPPTQVAPERGRQVDFQINPATGRLIAGAFQPLLRAIKPSMGLWQVTLSPVFRRSVGPVTPTGDVLPVTVATAAAPLFHMKFGAGGVMYEYRGFYPVQGGSFALAADNLVIDVAAGDATNAYTSDTAPSVIGWLTEKAVAQTTAALFVPQGTFPGGTTGAVALQTWARAVHAYAGDGGLVDVTFAIAPSGTPQTVRVPSGTRVVVPTFAVTCTITAVGAGASATMTQEVSFV